MHAELARRRAYLHLCRWTSLGLSLIEAMTIGMPIVALATTEAVDAVPPDAGVLSTRVDTLVEAARRFVEDPSAARRAGAAARRGRPEPLRPRPVPRRLGPAAGGGSMRIAMISEHASPLAVLGGEDAGGQNTHVAELAAALVAAGHDVRVYTRRDAVGPAGRVGAARRLRRRARARRPGRAGAPRTSCCRTWASSASWLAHRWRSGDWLPDVVHAHFWMSGLAALAAGRRTGVPVVQTYHALGTVKRRHQGAQDTSPPGRVGYERAAGPGGRPGRRPVPGRGRASWSGWGCPGPG